MNINLLNFTHLWSRRADPGREKPRRARRRRTRRPFSASTCSRSTDTSPSSPPTGAAATPRSNPLSQFVPARGNPAGIRVSAVRVLGHSRAVSFASWFWAINRVSGSRPETSWEGGLRRAPGPAKTTSRRARAARILLKGSGVDLAFLSVFFWLRSLFPVLRPRGKSPEFRVFVESGQVFRERTSLSACLIILRCFGAPYFLYNMSELQTLEVFEAASLFVFCRGNEMSCRISARAEMWMCLSLFFPFALSCQFET